MMGSTVSKAKIQADDKPEISMIEKLVPEIRSYALSYLDYSSLCKLSMTSSVMRKAANEDHLWKSLYHKEFTMEQVSITPVNGWKAYFTETKEIIKVNSEFFSIINERSLNRMASFWLNSDYVKCFNGSEEHFTGYEAVMQRWKFCLENWELGFDLEGLDVEVRVLTGVAWVTTLAVNNVVGSSFHITNIFEIHDGRWLMIHHHSSIIPTVAVVNHFNI